LGHFEGGSLGAAIQQITVSKLSSSHVVTVSGALGTFSQEINPNSSIVKLDKPPYIVSSIEQMINPPGMIGQIFIHSDPTVGTIIKLDSSGFRLGEIDGYSCTME
jgi:hypothetical protein